MIVAFNKKKSPFRFLSFSPTGLCVTITMCCRTLTLFVSVRLFQSLSILVQFRIYNISHAMPWFSTLNVIVMLKVVLVFIYLCIYLLGGCHPCPLKTAFLPFSKAKICIEKIVLNQQTLRSPLKKCLVRIKV